MAILCTQLYDKKDPKLSTHYSIRKKYCVLNLVTIVLVIECSWEIYEFKYKIKQLEYNLIICYYDYSA